MELKILPLGKDYPIYLQKEQKAELDKAPDGILLSLDGIQVLERSTHPICSSNANGQILILPFPIPHLGCFGDIIWVPVMLQLNF